LQARSLRRPARLAVGSDHLVRLLASGIAESRGRNECGQLGLGHWGDASWFTHVSVDNGVDLVEVSASGRLTAFLTKEGKVFLAGLSRTPSVPREVNLAHTVDRIACLHSEEDRAAVLMHTTNDLVFAIEGFAGVHGWTSEPKEVEFLSRKGVSDLAMTPSLSVASTRNSEVHFYYGNRSDRTKRLPASVVPWQIALGPVWVWLLAHDGRLYKLNHSSRDTEWQHLPGPPAVAVAACGGRTVVLTDSSKSSCALCDFDDNLRWIHSGGKIAEARPCLQSGVVKIAMLDHEGNVGFRSWGRGR